jgi:5-methylcytosine-specific restriction endonuclease McrA
MHDHTLLLATSFEPLKVISWKKAVTLLYLNKVEVIESYERVVRSPSTEFTLPAVVKLLHSVPRRQHKVKFSRQNLFFRDNYICQYCHQPHPSHMLTYDHVVPRSKGGKTTWTNIVTSCIPCNLKKGNRLPHAASLRLLRPPEEPRWLPTLSLAIRKESVPRVWHDYLAWAHK